MGNTVTAQEKVVDDLLKKKYNEFKTVAQSNLDHVHEQYYLTYQRALSKCTYECFDDNTPWKKQVIDNCLSHCIIPVLNAHNFFDTEMANFHENFLRSLMVCQDKYKSATLQLNSNNAMKELESCVAVCFEDRLKLIPHLEGKLKAYLPDKD